MTNKLDAALDLAGMGFRVFPLLMNGKDPVCEWKDVATTDPEKIKSLWTCPVFDVALDYNIGVAPDKDTIVVDVDVRDDKKGRASLEYLEAIHDDLPATYTVETPSGGEHRYFRTDRDSATFPAKLAEHIDLKGGNGYVVGPGSTIDGNAYRARGQSSPSEIALAPRWLRDLPAPRRKDKGDRVGNAGLAEDGLDTPAALERATEYLKTAPDHNTYKRAARVKDLGVSQDAAIELMLKHWSGADSREEGHIAFRVENAYRYGQNEPGSASPEAEFEPVDIPATDKPRPKRGLYVVRWDDAKPVLDRPYLIDDYLDLGSLVVTYGDSNVGKTYVVLDQARAIAAGNDWNGHKVKQGLVVYVASEGGTGFHKRIEAYRREFKSTGLPFSLVPCPIDLHSVGDQGDTDRLLRLIKAEEAHFGVSCVLVVIDTLARAMGGGDENTSMDMGLMVRHCDRIRATTGATVNLIHHTGKDKAKGARGSSSLRAATDTEIEVDAGVMNVQKQRDMAKAEPLHFTLKPVAVGERSDGREVTACVVEWTPHSEFENRVSPAAQELLDVLQRIVDAKRDEMGETDIPDANVAVAWPEWQNEALICLITPRGKRISRTALYPLRLELSNSGLVEKDKKGQWFIS